MIIYFICKDKTGNFYRSEFENNVGDSSVIPPKIGNSINIKNCNGLFKYNDNGEDYHFLLLNECDIEYLDNKLKKKGIDSFKQSVMQI